MFAFAKGSNSFASLQFSKTNLSIKEANRIKFIFRFNKDYGQKISFNSNGII